MDFDELRRREFGRLEAGSHAYLDYTGAGLYPESLIRAHADGLAHGVLGNPHSHNPASRESTQQVESARRSVLEFFDADPAEYVVAFTLNASGALKLVGESFPFAAGSRLLLTADNHNSVNGIREYAQARGAQTVYVPLDGELRVADLMSYLEPVPASPASLFAYPAQSNFSGVKHPLAWVQDARRLGYSVLLDAAAFVPTNPLSLRSVPADFLAVSFYKMFGFPTGVGALVARRESLRALRRPWFAGGTVRFASAQNHLHLLQDTGEAFEDGTLNFLDLCAVPRGLEFLRRIGLERLSAHVTALTAQALDALASLSHSGGQPLIRLYGPRTVQDRGGTIAFNVIDPDGAIVDFEVVEKRAAAAGISLRAGCFCNPGAAEHAFDYAGVDSYRCFSSIRPEEFTLQQFAICMEEKPVGAVRVSFGVASGERDVGRLQDLLRTFRDSRAPRVSERPLPELIGG